MKCWSTPKREVAPHIGERPQHCSNTANVCCARRFSTRIAVRSQEHSRAYWSIASLDVGSNQTIDSLLRYTICFNKQAVLLTKLGQVECTCECVQADVVSAAGLEDDLWLIGTWQHRHGAHGEMPHAALNRLEQHAQVTVSRGLSQDL